MVDSESAAFALCVRSTDYAASLEVRKIYRVVPDAEANKRSLLRVIDESGEDYLYPAEIFVPISLPKEAESVFAAGAR